MGLKALFSLFQKIGRVGTSGQANSADNRITILSNALVLFGSIAALAAYVQLIKTGFSGFYLNGFFLISGISITVWFLNFWGQKTIARILVVVLLNLSAWNALIFYGKSFNGYYLFFCAICYSIVAFDARRSLVRWGTLFISFLGLPLADYFSHQKVFPITGLNSGNFPVGVLVLDSVIISLLVIIIVFVEKGLAEKNEQELTDLNKNLEEIVNERTRLLKVATEEAQAASQAKSQFVANTSHELRTPLGAIIGFVDIILNLNPSEKEKIDYLRIVQKNAYQLSLIVDEVLDLSKIEAQKLSLKNEYFSLHNLLTDLQNLMAIKAEDKGLKFEFITTGELPTEIFSDPLRLRQVLVNLIGNAIKFTEHGRVTVFVDGQSFTNHEYLIRFDIEDTGVGILARDIGRLFQPFSQSDSGIMRKFGGTGLGLSLSKRLTEMLGGELSLVRTKVDSGSLFRVTLKCRGTHHPLANALASESPRKKSDGQAVTLTRRKILIVDDSTDNLVLIRRLLEGAGAEVDVAHNGLQAFEKARDQQCGYSAILMDLQMPIMDGYEATRRLRSAGCKIPIIALTASAMKEEREKAIDLGFTDYLTKPVQTKILLNTLCERTRRRESPA